MNDNNDYLISHQYIPTELADWTLFCNSSFHSIQLRILARAVEMLTPGGRIVYSTCTLNPVEDEAVVSTLLQKAEGKSCLFWYG